MLDNSKDLMRVIFSTSKVANRIFVLTVKLVILMLIIFFDGGVDAPVFNDQPEPETNRLTYMDD